MMSHEHFHHEVMAELEQFEEANRLLRELNNERYEILG